MLVAILIGFLLAPLAPILHQQSKSLLGWVVPLVPLGLFVFFASYVPDVFGGTVYIANYEWAPSLNVDFQLRMDGLALLFCLLITGIGTLVFFYAGGYLKGSRDLGKFYAYILVFMASMLGLVLANNIILLFIFWELTSISSFLLISYYHHKESAREAARTALVVTGASGLALLAGTILLAIVTDTYTISEMLKQGDAVLAHDLYLATFVLVAIGAFAKSAQFPFHFWLPGAMEGPAPVSAYLHSATMVKAGIYLLARLHPVLGGSDEWLYTLTVIGGITMLLGGYLAWQQTDVKRVLAYTTISALGIMVFMLGLGTKEAIKGAVLFLVVHSLYKGAFFMIGGTIDHETGTKDIRELSGLHRVLPFTAVGAAMAAVSMMGIPPALGFWGKEVIYEATYYSEDFSPWLITGIAFFGNLFNITAALMVAVRPFYGKYKETPKHAHEAPWVMWMGPIILGTIALGMGFFPDRFVIPFLEPVTSVVYGKEAELKLILKFNEIFALSMATIVAGFILYLLIDRLRPMAAALDGLEAVSPSAGYRAFVGGNLGIANAQKSLIQSSYLRYYLSIIMLVLVALVGYVLVTEATLAPEIVLEDLRVHEVIVAIVMMLAAITVTQTSSRLAAVAALGVVGLGAASTYIFFGAPDLAMTQLAIETLTVIVFVLVLYRLPRFHSHSSTTDRARDWVIAASVGVMMTSIVLLIISAPLDSVLSPYFAQNSYLEAKGGNVVNVILVDFRGMDTMGEIVVLAIAAIGAYGLLRLNLHDENDDENE